MNNDFEYKRGLDTGTRQERDRISKLLRAELTCDECEMNGFENDISNKAVALIKGEGQKDNETVSVLTEFDSHRYTTHDLAKHIIIYDFERTGWLNVHVNPDTYGADLIATSGRTGAKWTVEVEVKNNWETGAFKYNTIHISARKAKYNNDHHLHVTINKDWTHYLIVPPSALREARRVMKSTIYSENEMFLEIPITECQIIKRDY